MGLIGFDPSLLLTLMFSVVSRVCYERASLSPTIQTFILSAIWHGVYPGYYLTFLTGVVMTLAARAVSIQKVILCPCGGPLTWCERPTEQPLYKAGLPSLAPVMSTLAGSEVCGWHHCSVLP